MHFNAIGGDGPGKTEIHPDALSAAKIFVEYIPQTRIEGEIQQIAAGGERDRALARHRGSGAGPH